MKKQQIILLFFLFTTNFAFAQNDSTIQLKRVYTFYENGQKKKMETLHIEKVRLFDVDSVEKYKIDTCRDGLTKEWHPNGRIKLIGQYEYINSFDTVEIFDLEFGLSLTMYARIFNCQKEGIWYEFDSLGNYVLSIRYFRDEPIFIKSPKIISSFKEAKEDSVSIKLDYITLDILYINRSKNNKSLVLEIPASWNISKGCLHNSKIDLMFSPNPENAFTNPKEHEFNSFTCGRYPRFHQILLDFTNKKDGKYYFYHYSSFIKEIEIILETE